ncbi:MAG: MarR family transcriptional regulator [Anaeromyxobacter sp.]
MRNIHKGESPVEAQARRVHALMVQLSRHRSLRNPIAASCEDLGLTPAQIHLLLWLGTDGPQAMGELARRVAVTEKTITGIVDRLERDGLVQRVRDPDDRRVVRVELAARGKELFRRVDAEIGAKLVAFLQLIDAPDRRDLIRILEKLDARLTARALERREATENT